MRKTTENMEQSLDKEEGRHIESQEIFGSQTYLGTDPVES
jgi:hypothetical protein